MKTLVAAAALLTAAAIASLAFLPAAGAATCSRIKGHGIGATEGIARFMANKAVTDSAAKYAPAGKYTLSPVKLTCTGLSCSGEAKACKK